MKWFEEAYGKKLFPGDIRGLLSLPDVVGVLPLEDDLAEAYASQVESLLTGRSEAHVVDGALSSPCLCLRLSHSPTCGLLFPLWGCQPSMVRSSSSAPAAARHLLTQSCTCASDDKCVLLDETRCGISTKIAEHKLNRSLGHGIRAQWTFVSLWSNLFGLGSYDQLILCQDYLRLRTASARMCYCNDTRCGIAIIVTIAVAAAVAAATVADASVASVATVFAVAIVAVPAAGQLGGCFRACRASPQFWDTVECRNPTSDYCMLLRDVTVIEMGTELVPWALALPVVWSFTVPLFWLLYAHAAASDDTEGQTKYLVLTGVLGYIPWFFFFAAKYFSDDAKHRWWVTYLQAALPAVLLVICTAAVDPTFGRCLVAALFLYVVGIMMSTSRGWIRKPFVYFGVLVGTSSRSNTAFGAGASPFWVRLSRGQSKISLMEVVDSVRNAAKLSLQQDLAHEKRESSKVRCGPGFGTLLLVARSHRSLCGRSDPFLGCAGGDQPHP